ncbi:MAG TPA: hypothetical protein VN253_19355 [Kofleriaceae bacterium]|nr:hypothetical protein [Kofleriaceae bacterium]
MRAGGFNMWVLAALGIVLVWTAIRFARNADAQRLSVIRALLWALAFSTIAGFISGLGATAIHAANDPPEERLTSVLVGFAESTTNVTLGSGIAFITWILVAVGLRRMPGDRD